MRRTSIRDIVVALIFGVSAGYLTQSILVSNGLHMLVPPVTFTITLVVAAIAVLWSAWPIRSALRGTRKRPINALFASRVAVLAKASSVSGALLTGFTGGLCYFVLTRTSVTSGNVLTLLLCALGSAVLLLVAGLLSEWFCTLPPEETESEGAAHES
ncbi:MAG: DUF3180 domain-containing protein [Agromyces sp.]